AGTVLERRAGPLAREIDRSLRRYLAERTPESSPARSLVLKRYAHKPARHVRSAEPPLDYLQTVAWAAERGISEALAFRAREVLDPALVASLGDRDPTIEDLLRDPGGASGPVSSILSAQTFERLRTATIAWLRAYAHAERQARAGDRRAAGGLDRLPALPSLRALCERLLETRRALRTTH